VHRRHLTCGDRIHGPGVCAKRQCHWPGELVVDEADEKGHDCETNNGGKGEHVAEVVHGRSAGIGFMHGCPAFFGQWSVEEQPCVVRVRLREHVAMISMRPSLDRKARTGLGWIGSSRGMHRFGCV